MLLTVWGILKNITKNNYTFYLFLNKITYICTKKLKKHIEMVRKFKGTKGEWFSCCTDSTPHYLFTHEGELTICSFIKNQESGVEYNDEEMKANAKLIAAAPDLLEALLNIENDDNHIPKSIWDLRNKAINKALK